MKASPIGDAFVAPENRDVLQPLIPLDLYQCGSCGHVQNLDIVDPELLFRDYLFTTSSSGALVEHFRRSSDDTAARFGLGAGALVVEIGSNDGTLLQFYKTKGLRVIGVDPARAIARAATESGLPTIPEFFTSELARKIVEENGPAKLVVANNVYAHVDRLADLTDGIRILLDDEGVFVFEVSYLLDIVDKFLFDTVYHEHLSYHSIEPFSRFFRGHGLHLFDVDRIASKGGSMRGFVQRAGGPHTERPIVQEMIAEERRRGLHQPEIFREYEQQILVRKANLLQFVMGARRAGKTIAGYGASTTATTLTYQFELDDKLDFIIDDNPKKHGLYSPGCHLEVKPGSVLYDDPPDVVVVLAWQYAGPILSKHAQYVDNGGQFVVPLPELKTIGRETA